MTALIGGLVIDTRLPKEPTDEAAFYAQQIRRHLAKTVEEILNVGRLLIRAKEQLAHGEWGRMFDEQMLPFSQNTAGQLIAIAKHPVLSNSDHGQNLPPSWRTLYELTKVQHPKLKHALKEGRIRADMDRQAAITLHRTAPKSRTRDWRHRLRAALTHAQSQASTPAIRRFVENMLRGDRP